MPGWVASTSLRSRLQVLVGLGQVLAVGAVALEQVRHGVEAEPVEADVEPEADDVEHRLLDLGVVVVEVGLVVEEAVPVVLLALRVPRPVRPLGVDEDDAGLGPALVVVVPHVPVGLGVGAVLAGLLEPRVLVAGVVHHQVGDDADAAAVGLLDQLDGVGQVAVLGQDGEEVADVVAAVAQGRLVEGQQPEAVDAEPLEVVELLGEAPQVAGAVVVGVVEAADEDLVEDGPLVPAVVAAARSTSAASSCGGAAGAGGGRGPASAGVEADVGVGPCHVKVGAGELVVGLEGPVARQAEGAEVEARACPRGRRGGRG